MKTSELTGAALDWAVAKCEGVELFPPKMYGGANVPTNNSADFYEPSSNWAQGGPIIEREIAKIERFSDALWEATAFTKNAQDFVQSGPTPLIAAMRCYVASKMGDDIELPEELK